MKVNKKRTSTSLKHKKRKKMRKRSPSTSSSTSSSSTSSYSNSSNSSSTNSSGSSSSTCSSSSNDRPRKDKKKVTVQKPKGVLKRKHKKKVSKVNEVEDKDDVSADVPIDLMGQAKDMAPMTKEQWDKQQSVTKKVYDESTGRHRLIKGDGEVIEEIVSKERHKAINKIATKGDGDFFQQNVSSASFK